ncbi:MAG: LptA/OstA family protein [Pseudomonadota bacterium]
MTARAKTTARAKPILALSALLTLCASALSAPAAAQFAGAAGGNIELYADDAESSKGVTTLTGQVDARQDGVRILADRMVIYSKQDGAGGTPSVGTGAGDIERIVATGNFFYITPDQEVRGEQGVYTAAEDTFVVTGDVVLTQEDSVVRGTRLIYELATRTARVVADCEGRRCGPQRRVAILIKNTPDTGDAASS